MSISRNNFIFGLGTTQLIVRPGATLALFVPQDEYAVWTRLEYSQGGTLELVGIKNNAATLTAAQLAAGAGSNYVFRTTGAVEILGAPAFYLTATGSTAICHMIRGYSSGAA